jgi:ABC-type antimicrobial peptide transport system permease subunit
MRARTAVGHLLVGLGILLVSVPAGMVVAVLLFPFWRWLEESTGIESVGHSGPAEWCFVVSMVVCALALGSLYVAGRLKARVPNDG